MYPGYWARQSPDKPAVVMSGSGETVSYGELDRRSNRLAQFMWQAGLRRGDHIALLMENHPRYFEVYWAAIRSGLYITAVNRYLSPEEAAYIVNDCEAKLLVTSAALASTAEPMLELLGECPLRLMTDGACPGFESYEDAIARCPAEPLAKQPRGETMLYSSGTTGRPKGVWRPLPDLTIDDPYPLPGLLGSMFSMDADTVYLSPAPLYHASPLGFTATVQSLGGTVIVMEKFDARVSLEAIERFRVTHSQWVPTMFSRMLKLPEEERRGYDWQSHRVAIHAAAPCPPAVKRQMIDWWGPILWEYYGGTELNGLTLINSNEWQGHAGSVGRAVLGTIHICDEQGTELPAGEDGMIYFELPQMPFRYHRDDDKTRSAQHPAHPNWSALGDVGHLDEDGYLYLTDRKNFMIISGGINIYPAEIEHALASHPAVLDVAVIGVPNEDFGEEVKAIVQLAAGFEESAELERELLEFCRQRVAHYKCPRTVDFDPELPRLPTGKLYKRVLRKRYWTERESLIV